MPITQALYTGVTGLSVMSDTMSVVANNLANANAKGFKYDRAEFDDLLSMDLGTSTGQAQIGRGARLSDVRTIHTQGGLSITDRLTDLAVQGNGFFIVRNPLGEKQEAGGMFYTRVGAFNFDKDGYLSDKTGGRLQGYMADEKGRLSPKLDDVRIVTNNLPPVSTSVVKMNVNLDSRDEVIEEEFDIQDPQGTSNFVNSMNIFDSHGTKHAMTTYFRRVEDDEGISYEWFATADSKEVTDADDDAKIKVIGRGKVQFNAAGVLLAEETTEFDANFTKGALPNQYIEIDFGNNIGEEEGNGVGASTAVAADAVTVFHSQNGYEAGNIKSLKIDLDGKIKGYYTNGVEKLLASFALSTFENVDGLMKAGRNQFFATVESGAPRTGVPQSGVRGSIYASTLEESNVDMAQQFVEMIRTQRGFQANSRSITTTDTMIEEVVNMKR
ncbi:flagellar hook protein FlgE [Pseudobacteriovorax antillogorgiicola]|uniref:Flagellar hook protein FlgE n=1 Tax=Pseudobacteriovorax antillogorgiicola TaxID=1513793 RepID=A0A1Y6CC19_9BACT|nr:flagellar hook protein FlgE [Pseudobacteriovorax antillogorgiicola]TCS48635.1 flagellar hook protein FlgE [Pseudobacteriovorax antillogorgiicola]SMF55323.1 flagellar hook protein FlgE [Pseudobacteriovorax antillogorgiicola]